MRLWRMFNLIMKFIYLLIDLFNNILKLIYNNLFCLKIKQMDVTIGKYDLSLGQYIES